MRMILRRTQTRDPRGRTLATQSERLTDDGSGRVQVTETRTAVWCPGCRRPVNDLSELRGRCDHCRVAALCVRCEIQCQACSRRLCGRCRRGFAGASAMTVCPVCLVRLSARQAYLDRLTLRQQALQRASLQHREWLRLQQLRLQIAQYRTNAQFTVARERNRIVLALMRNRNRGRYLR